MNLLEQYLESYENLQEMRVDLLESPNLSAETIEYIFDEVDFSKHHWEELNDLGKMRELQSFEDKLAELLDRDSISIEAVEPSLIEKLRTRFTGSMRYGYYDPQTNKFYINKDLLESTEHIKDVVETVAHEGIHAYQNACVQGESTHHDPLEVEEWRGNFENYKDVRIYGYEIYRNQPLEAFAFDRGEAIANGYQYV